MTATAIHPEQLAINEAQLIAKLGLNDGRSLKSQKKACYQFRQLKKIKSLPGFVFSLRAVEKALDA